MFSFWKKGNAERFDYSLLQTDMHSHLIPGIDDGAPDMDAAVQLIKGLAELGYKKLITTPHVMWDMYKNTTPGILSGYEMLQQRIKEENIDITIGVAAEYFLDNYVKKLLANKEPLLTIKDNLVLVEFSMASEPIDLKEILFEMQLQGYQPVIAHPERYSYHERNSEFFAVMKSSGYWFQLNILSLAGLYGKSARTLAHNFIKNNYYELAGTDLHNPLHVRALSDPSITVELKKLLDSGTLKNMEL
jgi:tyrosine-protein phosphatase YwqE